MKRRQYIGKSEVLNAQIGMLERSDKISRPPFITLASTPPLWGTTCWGLLIQWKARARNLNPTPPFPVSARAGRSICRVVNPLNDTAREIPLSSVNELFIGHCSKTGIRKLQRGDFEIII
ncbi:hypothetical protein CDAR_294191 [Caerostris darwini]|uniref:Uncharacterized protein n=1 Tax=Caerostris darwini TaxID=1538125 RepID=A0AAV4TD27_9ARAC|nr:hypothetical protein CDAR_294191 [Caerostris darwini]